MNDVMFFQRPCDVRRVWQLHPALLSFRLLDPSSDRLLTLLMCCVQNHSLVRTTDGQRLCSFLFTISPALVKKIHAAIKTNLPSATEQTIRKYSELYVKV